MKNPCYGCVPETGRCAEPNCHMTCERYLAWKEEFSVNKENEYEQRAKEYDLRSFYVGQSGRRRGKQEVNDMSRYCIDCGHCRIYKGTVRGVMDADPDEWVCLLDKDEFYEDRPDDCEDYTIMDESDW